MRYIVIQQNDSGYVVALITRDYEKAKRKAEKITDGDYYMYGYVLSYEKEVPNKRLRVKSNGNEED